MKIKTKKFLAALFALLVTGVLFFVILKVNLNEKLSALVSGEDFITLIPNYYFYSYYNFGLAFILVFLARVMYQKMLKMNISVFSKMNLIFLVSGIVVLIIYSLMPVTVFTESGVVYKGVFADDKEIKYSSITTSSIIANISQHRMSRGKMNSSYECQLEYQVLIPGFNQNIILVPAEYKKVIDIKNVLHKNGITPDVSVNIASPITTSGPDCNQAYRDKFKAEIQNSLDVTLDK